MIQFTSLTWRNFLATGNTPTTIKLDAVSTTLILGTNGSGKSTILDAICFALFGKPFRKIKKGQMINTINGGDCLVEIEFTVGTNAYKVRRGIKPDLFELWENDSMINQDAAGRDYQQVLEETILKVNYESFTQVVILGNAKYTPFMQLALPKRREFIEHILDIGVFSQMNEVLKSRVAALKLSLAKIGTDQVSVIEQQALIEGFIAKLEAEAKKATKDAQDQIDAQTIIVDEGVSEINALTVVIDRLKKVVAKAKEAHENALAIKVAAVTTKCQGDVDAVSDTLAAETEVLENELSIAIGKIETKQVEDTATAEEKVIDTSDLEAKGRKFDGLRSGIVTNIASAQAKIDFYTETTSCKTCGQDIQESHRSKIISEKTEAIATFNAGLVKLDAQILKNTDALIDAKATNKAAQEAVTAITNASKLAMRELRTKTQEEVKALNVKAKDAIRALNTEAQTQLVKIKADAQAEIKADTGDDIEKIEGLTVDRLEKLTTVNAAKQYIAKLTLDMQKEPGNIQEQVDKLAAVQAKVVRLEAEKKEALETRQYYDIATVMLKDTGIKASIIRQYLPSINKLVNKYLTALDFFVSFGMDENFDETFKSRHRDTLSYYSFSQGEKLRIDLALLFAWREVAKAKNSCSTNLLILDEVIDSSLDGNGTDLFIKMLNDEIVGSNAFVISHKNDAALDRFVATLRFAREKNFSKLVEAA